MAIDYRCGLETKTKIFLMFAVAKSTTSGNFMKMHAQLFEQYCLHSNKVTTKKPLD